MNSAAKARTAPCRLPTTSASALTAIASRQVSHACAENPQHSTKQRLHSAVSLSSPGLEEHDVNKDASALDGYFTLLRDRPDLFVNPQAGGIEILTDPQEIALA